VSIVRNLGVTKTTEDGEAEQLYVSIIKNLGATKIIKRIEKQSSSV
jgi:hypothetical protein